MTTTKLSAQTTTTQFIQTSMGKIAVHSNGKSNNVPLLFLHGVYFDHHLWDQQLPKFQQHSLIRLDMPLHGQSKSGVPQKWSLQDCAQMLLEVLDSLGVEQVVGIGHSWGSMTLLRAAHLAPERFAALGLCNMPYEAATTKTRRQFGAQHLVLPFRKFYTKQVAKSMYGSHQEEYAAWLLEQIQRSMGLLKAKEVRQTDRAVIMYADDAKPLLEQLEVPALALKGEEDYVPLPPLPTTVVKGGHVSPLEVPEAVTQFIQRVLHLLP